MKPGTKVSFYRERDLELRKYFTNDNDSTLVFCTDVEGLINELNLNAINLKTGDFLQIPLNEA